MPRLLFPLAALAALALPASAQGAAPPDRDGIHVVGAWTLTVLDPDGSVVERREFHNDLTGRGADLLSTLLVGGRTLGQPAIGLIPPLPPPNTPADKLCDVPFVLGTAVDDLGGCYITTSEASLPSFGPPPIPLTLTTTPIDDGGLASGIRLSGTTMADFASEIAIVRTYFGTCDADIAPNGCSTPRFEHPFTERDLGDEALSVAAGQTVNVQVEISFE